MKSISRMKKISVLLLTLILLLAFFPVPNALAATYGPYSSITSMPVTAMDYKLCAMELHDTFSQVTYNGVKCYKFTGLGNTVYVNASAFRTTNSRSSYPSDSSVSGQLTANLNNNNSN